MKPEDNTLHGECLSDETLTDYLDGTLDPVVQPACEAHMVVCEPCRKRLANYMRILQPQVSLDEETSVQSVAGAWLRRHREVVEVAEVEAVEAVRKKRSGRKILWSAAVAAAILLLAFLGPGRMILQRIHSEDSTRDIVLKILTNERPFAAQLANEPYVALHRSPDDGTRIDYQSLSRTMSERAASQYDLGRLHLVQKQFPAAIKALEDAARDPKATADVHNDLGVAYMEQHIPDDMIRAEQEFKYALDLDHRFAPAVFNLSLFYDLTNRPVLAKQQRELYLQLDPASQWADDVRLKLKP